MDDSTPVSGLSRRGFLQGSAAAGLRAAFGGVRALAPFWGAAASRFGLAAIPLGGILTTVIAQDADAQQRSVPFRVANPHTGEQYSVDLFTGGDWNMRSVLVCHHLFRDWRENEVVSMDVKLYAALYVLQRYFNPGGESFVQINSGFRTEKTNELLRRLGYGAAPESFHLKAQATDFTIAGATPMQIAQVAQLFRLGGLGIYEPGRKIISKSRKIVRSGSGFVHMDSGPVGRIWFG